MIKRKFSRRKNENLIEEIEDDIEEEVTEVEDWIIERRNFFKKLGVTILIVLLVGLALSLMIG